MGADQRVDVLCESGEPAPLRGAAAPGDYGQTSEGIPARGQRLPRGIRRKEARGNRLEERGTRVRGPRIGQAQRLVLMVAHHRDAGAQGGDPTRYRVGLPGLGQDRLGLSNPADARQ